MPAAPSPSASPPKGALEGVDVGAWVLLKTRGGSLVAG